ncbi:MCE family protein [Nocardioides sp. R1-1]|uniref:MCE family protein n=1 Tax=Nocardioides sp. R1-1 TaxID=3383502 RepID=UPI0038D03BB2
MRTRTPPWRRLPWPVRLAVVGALAGLVLLGLRTVLAAAPDYHVRLRHAAGLSAGDDVRVAGLTVGQVRTVEAERDQVDVAFSLDRSPAELGITADSTVQVKLLSILGERFLALTPGAGEVLADGGTIPVERAVDPYTIEEFWLESTPQVQALDLARIQGAIDTLATDLAVEPSRLRDALDGIAGVSAIANRREQQLDDLLSSTRAVTDLVLSQTEQLDDIMGNGAKVMLMVQERRETLRALLDDAHRFVIGMTRLVRTTAPHLRPMLRDLRTVLRVFEEHTADLEETMRLAGPTMRVFTNATGDGPWLGVNAPWAIFPDDLVCALVVAEDCR